MPSAPLENVAAALRQRRENAPRTVEGLREEFGRYLAFFPADATVHRKHVIAGGVPGEWFLPTTTAPGRTLLYLHGGGYVIGDTTTHQCLIAEVAKACGARCLALNYRLAPEHPFPAAIDDALAAYRWLLSERVAPEKLVVAGDSAGGGLTLALLLAARDAGLPLPGAAVALSPWTDLAATGASLDTHADRDPMLDKRGVIAFSRYYLKGADPRTPLASPLYGELAGLPPLLVQVGSAEILLDDATRFAARAEAAGVAVQLEVWEEMLHVWHLFSPILREGREAIDGIGRFVGKHLR